MAENPASVDTISSVMEDDGDKMVTTQKGPAEPRSGKASKQGGPLATVKFGSAVVPIFRTTTNLNGRGKSSGPRRCKPMCPR